MIPSNYVFASNGNLEKKCEPQMGFEPMTFHDLVACTNH